VVALTFDDGPDASWTPLVLDALDAARAHATFFVVAEQIEQPGGGDLIAETLARGHDVQMHCARHLRHEEMSLEEVRADARAIASALSAHGVPAPTLWRPPYGSVNPDSSCIVAAESGVQLVRWSWDTVDYRGLPADEMLQSAREGLRADSVVLMHDSRRYSSTPEGGAGGTVGLIAGLAQLVGDRGWAVGPMGAPVAEMQGDAFLLPCGGH
jgi:peptidoglycan/xylan/chitin deacetylase (PgdA/CDA1 family)